MNFVDQLNAMLCHVPIISPTRQIVEWARLGERPRLERERFSGGVNLSAQERNRKRLDEARTIYTVPWDDALYCAPWVAEELREEFQR